MLVMRIHRIVVFYFSGPDKNEDDDLIFEDFARLRLKGAEHLDSADAWLTFNATICMGGEREGRIVCLKKLCLLTSWISFLS